MTKEVDAIRAAERRDAATVAPMTEHTEQGSLSRSLEFRVYYFTARYEATVAFYRDVLQLHVHHSWDHGPEARGTIFRAPNGSGLIEIEAGAGLPALTGGFYIEVPEPEAWYARLKDAGSPIVPELRTTSYGHRHFKTVDPSGIEIGIFRNLAQAPHAGASADQGR